MVKLNKANDPIDMNILSADGIMLAVHDLAHLVAQYKFMGVGKR